MLRQAAAADRKDWDAFAGTCHPAHEYVDRRRALRPPADATPLAPYDTMFQLDDWELRRTLLATRGERFALVQGTCLFQDGATGPAESTGIGVMEVADDGRLLRETAFEPDDLQEALAELDARWQAVLGATAALDARWQELQRTEDPLAIPRTPAVRSVAKAGWTLLAALGDHLCLHDTGERLVMHEVDDAGEVITFLTFDRDDRRSATDEIARRAYARVGNPAPASAMSAAMNARDLVAMRACLADACVIEDHRQLRVVPMQTADEYVATVASVLELAPEYRVETLRLDAVEPWGQVVLILLAGTTTDGASFESPVLSCTAWDEDGRVALIAIYEPEDVEDALDRLAAADPALRREPSVWDRFGRLVRAVDEDPPT
jgi:hypothetical protein